MRTDRIFMLYKKFSKQVGDTALPTESLNFYLENSKEYLGVQNSVRFKNILKGVEVTKELEAGGQKYYKKTSVTKQALCFDYTELMANYNINLNIDMGMPDEEEGGGIINRRRTKLLHINFNVYHSCAETLACEGRGFFLAFLRQKRCFILGQKMLLHFLHFLHLYKSAFYVIKRCSTSFYKFLQNAAFLYFFYK
jgi:hypothetical protein